MKLFAIAVLALPLHASAACIALDYQEMKDMSIEQLVAEACRARDGVSAALDAGMAVRGRNASLELQAASDSQAMCSSQIRRIERVLELKGSPKMRVVDRCKLPPSASLPVSKESETADRDAP